MGTERITYYRTKYNKFIHIMKKFKISGVGVDLRNVTSELSSVALTQLTPNSEPLQLDYVMIDLLHPSPHLTHEVAQEIVINGGVLIVYVDFSKFDSTIDPWIQAYELWKQWKTGYWKLPTGAITILFENLPEFKSEFLGNGLWKNEKEFSYLGLVISKQEGWLDEEKLWRSWLDTSPEVIARPINPLFFNYELEEWCKLGNPVTIGLELDGGKYRKSTLKEVFGDSYLLGFASYHSQAVLYPLYNSFDPSIKQRLEWLKEVKGREIEDKEAARFELKKNVSRLPKVPKSIVHESFKLPIGSETWTIPISTTSEIFYPFSETVYSFSTPKIEITPLSGREDYELSDLEYRMKQEFDNILNPIPTSSIVAWKMILLTSADFLSEEFKETDRWSLEFCSLGEYAVAINALHIKKKNWITKYLPDEIDKQKSFLLVMKSPDSIYFLDIDSLETPKKKKEK